MHGKAPFLGPAILHIIVPWLWWALVPGSSTRPWACETRYTTGQRTEQSSSLQN